MGKGLEFFQEHMGYIERGDIEGLLRDHYTDDCEMVTFEFTLKGKEALRKYLTVDNPAQAGKVYDFEVKEFAESDDVIMFAATVTTEKLGTFVARDSFYLRDGKVYRHIALTLPPDKDIIPKPLPKSKGKEFYREQLALMSAGEIDELVEKHYHPDAIMVTFDGIRHGHAELKKYYMDTLKLMGKISYLSTQYFAEIEDVIIFKAVITSEGRGTVHADNAFYMKEGKIYRHIALTILPDIDYDKMGTRWTDD